MFEYNNLNNILCDLYFNGIRDLDITLIISLEKEYYEGDNLKNILNSLKSLIKNKKLLLKNGIEFKVNKLQFDVGDSLNRHMWYYRYCAEYFKKQKIDKEYLIPEEIRNEFKRLSYLVGRQQGREWFFNNARTIFNIFNNGNINNVVLGDGVTRICDENEETPVIEYMCYDYWLNHPRYKEVENALLEVCSIEDSIIKRAYTRESEFFYDRLVRRNETPEYKDLFIKQSYKYLFDESIPATIKHSSFNDNDIEFYYNGRENNFSQVFKGKKVSNNKVIQEYLHSTLMGADKRKFVSIKPITI